MDGPEKSGMSLALKAGQHLGDANLPTRPKATSVAGLLGGSDGACKRFFARPAGIAA
jgi:hypothetical protein